MRWELLWEPMEVAAEVGRKGRGKSPRKTLPNTWQINKAKKKAAKVAKKLEKQHNISGYANESNPFGDSNLNERFVWRKKIERDVAQGVPIDAYSLKEEKRRERERMEEVEKAKKRREEKAIEKAQREEEKALLARERARAEFEDWEKEEEEFHFNQSKVRSEIRLQEGRIKPIDILVKHLNPLGELDMEIDEPYMVFKGSSVDEMVELHEDIKLHLNLDRAAAAQIQYWDALMVVCDWEIGEVRQKDALDRARLRGERLPLEERRGMHSFIEADVKNCLQGKSYAELEALQSRTESEMRSGGAKVVEFWESLIRHLRIFKAKAFLKENHAKMLRKHLQRLEKPLEVGDGEILSPEPTLHEETQDVDKEAGSFSPELFHGDDNEEAMDPEEDEAILDRKRLAVLQERRLVQELAARLPPPPPPPEDNLEKRALKALGAMEEGDATSGSNNEIRLDSQVDCRHDKYCPRKPKYFNRVHTGYEWNKYNQTHYDHDNPPPKFVMGYKFNIFYPDLIENWKAPSYTLEQDGDSTETCIIRFHAGPPYEDIAFRIVNNDWELSHKKGFKLTFERGILHLYFNFKRYRYRR